MNFDLKTLETVAVVGLAIAMFAVILKMVGILP